MISIFFILYFKKKQQQKTGMDMAGILLIRRNARYNQSIIQNKKNRVCEKNSTAPATTPPDLKFQDPPLKVPYYLP